MSEPLRCNARIRPFPNDVEVRCENEISLIEPHAWHEGTLRDYAYPGSATVMKWAEDDRRTFRGDWPGACSDDCELPKGHRGEPRVTCEIIHGQSELVTPTLVGPVHCICTDPPYGMDFSSGSAQTAKGKQFVQKIENDNDLDQATGIFFAAVLPLVDIAADEADMYVFCRWSMIGHWTDVVNELRPFEVKNVLVWDKGTPGMGDVEANWGFSWEAIIYAKKGRRKVPRRRSSVLTFDRTPSSQHFHPTQKPVPLLEELLKMSMSPGDLVVDPFAGSGSTIVAAERLGMRGIGIELDENFVARGRERLGQNLLAI